MSRARMPNPWWVVACVVAGLVVVAVSSRVEGEAGRHRPPCGPSERLTPDGWCLPDPSKQPAPVVKSAGSPRPLAPGEWVLVKAGSFTMGSPPDEPGRGSDETQHQVTITRDYWLMATEVTQGQWREVMGSSPSYFTGCGSSCPVERVNWYEAVSYANRLSEREGLPRCYELSGCSGTIGSGCPTSQNGGEGCAGDFRCTGVRSTGPGCRGYRLPTEAEWEHAARAGTTTALYTGPISILGQSNAPALDPIAWYSGNSGVSYAGGVDCSSWREVQHRSSLCGTHPVKQKSPNAWGFYDMLGNVWEWCHDWYRDDNTVGDLTDPSGPVSGPYRVLRGGGWSGGAQGARAAGRDRSGPEGRGGGLGLRVAVSPASP